MTVANRCADHHGRIRAANLNAARRGRSGPSLSAEACRTAVRPLLIVARGLGPCYLTRMSSPSRRITSEPDKFGGRPCIRGLRIRVVDVLDLLAAGLSHAEIVEELPDLEVDDIKAALAFAARRVDHPLIAAE